MPKRNSLSLILVVITLVTISSSSGLLLNSSAENADTNIAKIRLCGTAEPHNSVSVMFVSSTNGTGKVEYGLTDQFGEVVTSKKAGFLHEIMVNDLSPNSTYYYHVGIDRSWSEIFSFRTAPSPSDSNASTRFVAWGDSRTETSEEREVRREIAELTASFKPDFQIFVGDLVTGGAVDAMWEEWFDDFEIVNAISPLLSTVGNHEEIFTSSNYKDLLSFPGNEYYFSLDYGPVHITILNTEAVNEHQTYGDYWDAQRDWLIKDLSTTRQPWKIVAFHRPLFTSGSHRNDQELPYLREAWEPILKQFNVDIVFAGHDHHYERSYKDEITHVTTGGAGAPLRWTWAGRNPYSVIQRSVFHTCIVEANRSSFQYKAYDIDGSIIDTFTLKKKENELAVQKVEVTDYPLNTSSSFGIKSQVVNSGMSKVENVSVLFELDDWSWETNVSLDPGQTKEILTPTNLSVNTADSTVHVTIDPYNGLVENHELNNHYSLDLFLPSDLPDLQINRIVPLETWSSDSSPILYGLEVQNSGISPVESITLSYITDKDYHNVPISQIDGLETVIVELGTVIPADGVFLEAIIDPLNEIAESNEGNNGLYYGWNGVSNKTVFGATFPEYLRPGTPFQINYNTDGALSNQSEVGFIYSDDGWITFTIIPLNKTDSENWEGRINFDSSEELEAFNFGFTTSDQTDFAGQGNWTVHNYLGSKACLDFPLVLTITNNESLVVNFLDTRTYNPVSTVIKGWIIFNGTVYEPVINGNGFMNFDVSNLNLSTDAYDITFYAWTQDFEAIKIKKYVGLIFFHEDTSETTVKKTTFLDLYMILLCFFSLPFIARKVQYRKKK